MSLSRVYRLQALQELITCKSFYLPVIPCSIPFKCHPDYQYLSKQANEWVLNHLNTRSIEKRKTYIGYKSPLYACFTVPDGETDKLLAVCKYIWLITIQDDFLEDYSTESNRDLFYKIAAGDMSMEKVPNNGVFKAQADVFLELPKLMSHKVFNRFMDSYKQCINQFGAHKFPDEVTLDQYVSWRREDVLLKPLLQYMEMCSGVELKDKDLESEEYFCAVAAMMDYFWMVNDVFSFAKELRKGTVANVIPVLLFTDPCVFSVQAAVDKVCNMIQEKEHEFKYYHEVLTRKAKETKNNEFLEYLRLLPAFISGSLRWHYISARYHGVDNPCITGEPFSGTWLLGWNKTVIIPECKEKHPYLLA